MDRLGLALIRNAHAENQGLDEEGKLKGGVMLCHHPCIAPMKGIVFLLAKAQPERVAKAKAVRDLLRPHMTGCYDKAGAIGRSYRRQDEADTPFGVTTDFDTPGDRGRELKDTVTLRDRDGMKQGLVQLGTRCGGCWSI
jgi:glycyl-tRNA synthetase